MPDNGRYIHEWFEKGGHDLATATLSFNAGGPADTIVVLLQQAAEKYVKGYLLSRGWRLKKTHDLRELIYKAMEHNPSFGEYLELARRLTAFYLEERYPSGSPVDYPREEIDALMEQTKKLIALIKKATNSVS